MIHRAKFVEFPEPISTYRFGRRVARKPQIAIESNGGSQILFQKGSTEVVSSSTATVARLASKAPKSRMVARKRSSPASNRLRRRSSDLFAAQSRSRGRYVYSNS